MNLLDVAGAIGGRTSVSRLIRELLERALKGSPAGEGLGRCI